MLFLLYCFLFGGTLSCNPGRPEGASSETDTGIGHSVIRGLGQPKEVRHRQVNGPPGALKSFDVDHMRTCANKAFSQIAQTLKGPDAPFSRPGKLEYAAARIP